MGQQSYYTGSDTGGIKRGDGKDTGDLTARPAEKWEPAGSGSKAGESHDLEDLTVLDADDPTLGLTDIGDVPPDDWAADTGPTHSAEENPAGRRP